MRSRALLLSLAVIFIAGCVRAEDDGERFYKQGVDLLREVMAGQDAKLVPAAEALGKAVLLFEAAGKDAKRKRK